MDSSMNRPAQWSITLCINQCCGKHVKGPRSTTKSHTTWHTIWTKFLWSTTVCTAQTGGVGQFVKGSEVTLYRQCCLLSGPTLEAKINGNYAINKSCFDSFTWTLSLPPRVRVSFSLPVCIRLQFIMTIRQFWSQSSIRSCTYRMISCVLLGKHRNSDLLVNFHLMQTNSAMSNMCTFIIHSTIHCHLQSA